MDRKNNWFAWLYLLPAIAFLGVFMLYPLVDVVIYSFEENYQFINEATGIGFANYQYILNDSSFLQAVKNTFLLVIITVPLSTIIALLISVGLCAIKPLRNFLQTIYFLPYVTNTLAIGLVFAYIFQFNSTQQPGLINIVLGWFGISPQYWVEAEAPYAAKLFVLCTYVIWYVMPFKILVLTGAIASVRKEYYQAASLDGASRFFVFRKITVPQISPMISYLVITGYITARTTWWNNAASFYLQDSDGGYYVYNLACDEEQYLNSLTVGSHLVVTGAKAEWKGEHEINYVTATENQFWFIANSHTETFTAANVSDIAVETLAAKKNCYVNVTNLEVTTATYTIGKDGEEAPDPASGVDLYFAVKDSNGNELTFVVEAYLEYSQYNSTVYNTVLGLQVGDVIDLSGYIYYWETPQMQVVDCTVHE